LPTGGVEIISPIMDIKTALDYMKKMFEFIKKHGETTRDTGLHVNMSYKGKPLRELDTLKLMLFMDEGWVWRHFPERKDNRYAKSNFDEIKDNIQSDAEKHPELEKITNNLVQKYKQKVKGPDEKFFGINTSHDDRIEFRYLGSSNYHKKYNDIQTAIGKYAFYLKIGLDPKERQNEYVLKLERLFNKYSPTNLIKYSDDIPSIILDNSFWIPLHVFMSVITRKYSKILDDKSNKILIKWIKKINKIRRVIKFSDHNKMFVGIMPAKQPYFENTLKKLNISYIVLENSNIGTFSDFKDISDFGNKIIIYVFINSS
jgi:hypothetical protein